VQATANIAVSAVPLVYLRVAVRLVRRLQLDIFSKGDKTYLVVPFAGLCIDGELLCNYNLPVSSGSCALIISFRLGSYRISIEVYDATHGNF
jgi:hypothetical protein